MWRVGSKVPINVYDGDRPVCQCQTALDAKVIVRAVNEYLDRIAEAKVPEESEDADGSL